MAAAKGSSFDALPVPGKLLVLALVLGFVGVVYYFAFHRSLAESLEDARAQKVQLDQQLMEAEQRQQRYIERSAEFTLREPIDRANKRVLPEQAEIAAFLQDLNRVAELSGLSTRLVQPRPELHEEAYTRIPVQLELSGTFHELAKFFYNIGRLERVISMENIELTAPKVVDGSVVVSVSVLATTYRQPEQVDAAAGGGS
jgi:type IV pilus assembly protein PilO